MTCIGNMPSDNYNRKIKDHYTVVISLVSAAFLIAFLVVLNQLGEIGNPQLSLLDWPFAGLEVAILAGVLGACFSILTGDSAVVNGVSIEETLLKTGPAYVFLRLGVGSLSATILYFSFESGVLTSDLLPNLEAVGFFNTNEPASPVSTLQKALENISDTAQEDSKRSGINGNLLSLLEQPEMRQELASALASQISPSATTSTSIKSATSSAWAFYVPNANLSKLLIWSFAAGFFEKLVPKALQGVTKETEKT